MVKISVDKARCKGCNICISICPKQVFVKSIKRGDYGANIPEAKNQDKCIECRMCERMCPDGAIDVEHVGEDVK